MRRTERVVMLQNEIEAQRFDSILDEEGIAHRIVSYHDSAYDGLFQSQMGWGHVQAEAKDAGRIVELYEALKKSAE